MAFGRSRKRRPDPDTAPPAAEDQTADTEDVPTSDTGAADTADTGATDTGDVPVDGPFDIDDFDDPAQAEVARLDLGSVLIPVPETGQLQVELTETGVPSAIWVVTQNGRFTIAAYAAPKTSGLWREVASELAEALRKDSANVSIEDGPWGREVVGAGNNSVRFVGVDGYRWMIRC
ncbi:MAG: DUF3710 domain-containing protein, partial [Mycolicibacterium sp.]|nr:DUF3710 domain-containing protein [Mycolicibacterium sp.]